MLKLVSPEHSAAPAAAADPAPPAPVVGKSDTALLRRVRWTPWIIAALLALVLAWVALAPLDEGVPAPGQVVIDTRAKPVQHPTGGVVLEVMAREGMAVQAGTPLLRLDTAGTSAAREVVRQRYYALRSAQNRLVAERDGLTRIVWHADLDVAAAVVHRQSQEALMQSRRAALQAELAGLSESQQAQQAALRTVGEMLLSRREQLRWIREEMDSTAPLVEQGYVPRNRLLELQRQRAEADALIAELNGQQQKAMLANSELGQRRLQRTSEFRRDIQAQLSEVLRDVDAEAQRLVAADQDLQRTEVVAPVDGYVIALAVQSPGSVVQAAQRLMDIVPTQEALLIESRVPPHLADRVRRGQVVDIRFAAFAHTPQLLVEGTVQSISADVIHDTQNQQSYFLARMSITAEGMQALADRKLVPGLPAEVVFRTGERSLLTYWLHPLTKRLAASMKEE